jgi:hypothetical protein
MIRYYQDGVLGRSFDVGEPFRRNAVTEQLVV